MRKRKVNPSLELATSSRDINLIPGGDTVAAMWEVAAVGSQPTGSQPGPGVPTTGQQPCGADVAPKEVLKPHRIEEGGTELRTVDPIEVGITIGPIPPSQERVLVDQLEEAEVHVAEEQVSEPHWFWELLEEAGYDVW